MALEYTCGMASPASTSEPLREELSHFADCVRTRKTPHTDGKNGLDVLRVLDAGQRSLDGGGKPVAIKAMI